MQCKLNKATYLHKKHYRKCVGRAWVSNCCTNLKIEKNLHRREHVVLRKPRALSLLNLR